MKRIFVLSLAALILVSCGDNNKPDLDLTIGSSQQNQSEAFLDRLEIQMGKEPIVEKTGLRFEGVGELEAMDFVAAYFDSAHQYDQYIYLNNLHVDDQYRPQYDVVTFDKADQFELLKHIGTKSEKHKLTNQGVTNWFKSRQQEFDFQIIVCDPDRVEAIILQEPPSYELLADQIYAFCPDVIDQGHADKAELISFLKREGRMWFWWDEH